jgi:hypothetical protein
MRHENLAQQTSRSIRLNDLNPEWIAFSSSRHGTALLADCPCGCDESLVVPLSNPIDGGPPDDKAPFTRRWLRYGQTFEDLTIEGIIRVCSRDESGERHLHWEGTIVRGALWPA